MHHGPGGVVRRVFRWLLATAALAAPVVYAVVVSGAPQTAPPPAIDKPPGADAASPVATTHTAAPAAATTGKALSGGGDGPHGAMPMEKQLAALPSLVKPLPAGAAPGGIDPAYWKALVPSDNAPTEARVALGRKLYFDPRLSNDGTVACATCHDVSRGFSDRRGTSEGVGDKLGQRNSPTTMNALFFSDQFWDGRALTLEDQAKLPIVNPIEMGHRDAAAATAAIKGDPEYQKAFQAAYDRAPNFDDIARALASFQRTLVFVDAPFDRFVAGDLKAIDDDAKAGWVLYNGKGRCMSCHQLSSSSPIGTDNRFHNVGVSARKQNFEALAKKALDALAKDSSKEAMDRFAIQTDLSELGRFVVTRNRSDIGAFKTEQVRNVGVTAPYMHDGSMATLWDVMDHYNKGGEPNAFLDGGIEPLALSEKEIDQLVAFMFSLTDVRFAADNDAERDRQRRIAVTRRPFRDDAAANRKVLPFERRAAGQK
jgi:cytochrome c peroxidase